MDGTAERLVHSSDLEETPGRFGSAFVGPYFLEINAWTDSSKTTLVTTTPITAFASIGTHLILNQAFEYTVNLFLEDPNTGGLASGQYIEVTWGIQTPDMLLSGIILDMVATEDDAGTLSLTVHSAALVLTHFNNYDRFVAHYPDYKSVGDVINGLVPIEDRPAPPGKKGFLDPTGWWADWVAPVGDTSTIPGNFDSGRADWGNPYQNVTTICDVYSLFWREERGSTGASGRIAYGPLGDDSGIWAYGTDTLNEPGSIVQAAPLPTRHQVFVQTGYGATFRTGEAIYIGSQTGTLSSVNGDALNIQGLGYAPNPGDAVAQPYRAVSAAEAQARGLIVISAATVDDSTTNLKNIIFPMGKGSGDNMITLRSIFGDVLNPDGSLATGITKMQWNAANHGLVLYVKTGDVQSWRGNSYALCAAHGNDGYWNYGIMDMTLVNKYGPIMLEHRFPRAVNADILLSLGLGFLDSARPVKSWTFGLRYPLIHTDTPLRIWPGKKVNILYSGAVHSAIQLDSSGQWVGVGAYQYLTFPGTNDPNDLFYLNRVMEVTEQFDDTGYTATVTMGKGRKKSKYDKMLEQTATAIEQHRHTPQHHVGTEVPFAHHEWVLSKGASPAYADEAERCLVFTPGSWGFVDISDAVWFKDHRRWQFDINVSDDTTVFESCFAKAVDGTLPGVGSSKLYGVFRMAFKNSGQSTGFYTTTNGVAYTHRGVEVKGAVPTGGFPAGKYRVEVWMSGGDYEANISMLHDNTTYGEEHNVVAIWNDDSLSGARAIDLTNGWGSVGYRVTNGSSYTTVQNIRLAYEKKHTKATVGGHNGHHATYHHTRAAGSTKGNRHVVVDQATNTTQTSHHFGSDGSHHQTAHRVHGPFGSQIGIVKTITVSGGVTTVLFNQTVLNNDPQNPIMPHAFQSGWHPQLMDGSGRTVQIQSVLRGFDVSLPGTQNSEGPYVVGFTTTDPNASALTVGSRLQWDSLEEATGAVGHMAIGTLYRYKGKDGQYHRDWCHALLAAGAVNSTADAAARDGKALIIAPDGSIHHAEIGQVIQANGQVIQIADLTVSARHFAKKTEHEGAALFDAGEYDSSTQEAYLYPSNYPTGARALITPNSTGFYGGDPSATQASWVATSSDGQTGEADNILQLTATSGYPTALWQDTQILLDGGQRRTYIVSRDSSFRFPILIGIGQSSSTLGLGSQTVLRDPISPGSAVKAYIDRDPSTLGSQNLDTWIINPGGTTQETVTISSLSIPDWSVVLSSVAYSHVQGEAMMQKTANGGTAVVQSGGILDGTTTMGDVTPAVNAIAVGFYDGTTWYRGWWGDPAWTPPYLKDTGLPGYAGGQGAAYLGKLNLKPGVWGDLSCKASQLGLYGSHLPKVTIIGVELAVYGASAGSGQTVYFDAHDVGFTQGPNKLKSGSAGPAQIANNAIQNKHKDPQHNSDMHTHSDVLFWMDPTDYLHWESGWLVNHDGTNQWTINGGTEAAPNTGLYALISGQLRADGNYILFNTTNAAISLKDPLYGTVTIPAYSATGGPGGQTVGFGFVSENYKFNARTSGANVKGGLPKGLYKIGKCSRVRDAYTGELGVQTHHGSGKKQNRHLRTDAVDTTKVRSKTLHGGEVVGGNTQKDHHADKSHSRRHDQDHKPGRAHHLGGMRYEMFNSGGIDYLQVTAGNVNIDDGATSYAVQSRYWQVNPGDYVYINRTELSPYFPHSVNASTWASSYTDDWIGLLRVTDDRDADGLLGTAGHHHGPHKIHGDRHVKAKTLHGGENSHVDHHADKSHSRRHAMDHMAYAHLHHDTSFEVSDTNTLYVNYASSASGPVGPSRNSTIQIVTGGTSYTLGPGIISSLAAGDYIYVDITGYSGTALTPQRVASGSWTGSNDNYIILCRISSQTDANGRYMTEGHHHGPHKVSDFHLVHGAVYNRHLDNVAVAGGKVNWGTTVPSVLWGSSMTAGWASTLGNYWISSATYVSFTISNNQWKNMHSYEWMLGCATNTSSTAPGSIYSLVQPTIATSLSNNNLNPGNLVFDPGAIVWADGTGEVGFILNGVELNSTSVSFRIQTITNGVGGGGWPSGGTYITAYVFFWLTINGMLQ